MVAPQAAAAVVPPAIAPTTAAGGLEYLDDAYFHGGMNLPGP
jgi:hypothetical protein